MKSVIAFGFVLAVACCCNAGLYHLKQRNLGVCDLRIVRTEPLSVIKFIDNTSAHGDFIRKDSYSCVGPFCKIIFSDLYRPDLVNGSYAVKHFSWDFLDDGCKVEFLTADTMPKPYNYFDDYFEIKTPAVFNGVNCSEFRNETSRSYYGDDELQRFYGQYTDESLYFLDYYPDSYKASDFVFNPKVQKNCEADAYSMPPQDMFDRACDKVPKKY